MKHRYRYADRMMGLVDLVPVAEQQMELQGKRVGKDWIIAVDLSDISRKYASKLEALGRVVMAPRDRRTSHVSHLDNATILMEI